VETKSQRSPESQASALEPILDRNPRPHVELAESLLKYARQFPWANYEPGENAREGTWRLWNLGFVKAATFLLQAIVVLFENGLGREAQLQLRSLMELVGNQYYMGQDKRRAVEFAAAQAIEQQRLIEAGLSLNALTTTDADEMSKIAERIKEDREAMKTHLGKDAERELEKQMYPFGRKASIRLAAAGMKWHYELPYEMASNLMHMNARAVAFYLGDESRESEGAGTLVLANEMMLRVLYKADEALDQGALEAINRFGTEHSRRAYPGQDIERILQYLRGEVSG
jgi:hypothetical protein